MPVSATSAAGLPAFVVESDGPVRVALAFRVGTSDERLVEAGVTHLVEHLAMHALGRRAHDSNAFVDALRTVFYATGTLAEVTAFLKDVCTALQTLPLDRLELERRVLLTEAARRGGSAHDELLAYRFGPRTYGVRAYAEHGLRRRLQADDVAAWTAGRFTAGTGRSGQPSRWTAWSWTCRPGRAWTASSRTRPTSCRPVSVPGRRWASTSWRRGRWR